MVLAAIIAAFVLAGALLLKHGWESHAPHRGAQVLPAAPAFSLLATRAGDQ
jgi:hypothetical protein